MKHHLTLLLLLFTTTLLLAQDKCKPDFKKLEALSKRGIIPNNEFLTAVSLIRTLETNNCVDYIVIKNEKQLGTSRTYLFGEICLNTNSRKAIEEYVKYMQRNSGSAEEEISFSFERLFVNRPNDVLSIIGSNKDLLNQLEWGFVNNHYQMHLTPANCKTIFYKVNPKVKVIYPKYKKQIDFLLSEIAAELKE